MDVYELVELSTGEVVLKRSDGEGEALFTITLGPDLHIDSPQQKAYIAKQMIQAGMDAVEESLHQTRQELQAQLGIPADPVESFEAHHQPGEGEAVH